MFVAQNDQVKGRLLQLCPFIQPEQVEVVHGPRAIHGEILLLVWVSYDWAEWMAKLNTGHSWLCNAKAGDVEVSVANAPDGAELVLRPLDWIEFEGDPFFDNPAPSVKDYITSAMREKDLVSVEEIILAFAAQGKDREQLRQEIKQAAKELGYTLAKMPDGNIYIIQ